MADISAFPSKDTLTEGDSCIIKTPLGPAKKYTLAAAGKAGQVVVFGSVAGEVTPGTGAVTEIVAGVLDLDGEDGDEVLVWLPGNIAKLTNFSTTVAITQGKWVQTNDNSVNGTINEVNTTPGGTAYSYHNIVGIALEGIAASSSGDVLIVPGTIYVPTS